MNEFATRVIEEDRDPGAYERTCFDPLMARWAVEYGVESALEGPVDGMAGVRGVHCAGLARDGIRVASAVTTEAAALVARRVYGHAAPRANVDVRVVSDEARVGELPVSDLVLVYHALPFVDDWRAYLASLAKLARKVLIVATGNPDRLGFTAARWTGRAERPEVWKTETLAPSLWALGRVRDHVYFDAPRWLQASSPGVVRRMAHRHAFVVDTRPRTPQARRRLAQVALERV